MDASCLLFVLCKFFFPNYFGKHCHGAIFGSLSAHLWLYVSILYVRWWQWWWWNFHNLDSLCPPKSRFSARFLVFMFYRINGRTFWKLCSLFVIILHNIYFNVIEYFLISIYLYMSIFISGIWTWSYMYIYFSILNIMLMCLQDCIWLQQYSVYKSVSLVDRKLDLSIE